MRSLSPADRSQGAKAVKYRKIKSPRFGLTDTFPFREAGDFYAILLQAHTPAGLRRDRFVPEKRRHSPLIT